MNLNSLNKEQQKAVTTIEGPLLVLAGAGSGKTRVLTNRIAYMIEQGISPYNILAITFTNKAAGEMKERIIGLIGSVADSMQISTFHSFGLKILRENHSIIGYQSNITLLDSEDTLSVIKKILKDYNLDPKVYNPKAIRNKISSCKNELIDPKKYEIYAVSDYEKTVLEIYIEYEKILKKNNSVDFDDLLILPIEIFKKSKEILEKYQERFKYILIDEYQDINEAQYLLTKMISDKYKNICVVGDNDQAIYSFRGANFRNILNFEKDYPKALTIKLEENYRSTTNILEAANSVIRNNKNRKDKNLISIKGDGENLTYYRGYNEQDEVDYVVKEIKKLEEKGVSRDDIVVLYRTNAQSHNFEEGLLKENIPYRMVGSIHFYARKEIKDLLAYLRLIYNDKDNISLLRAINTPKRGIGTKTIDNLIEKADKQGVSIYEAIDSGKELQFKELIEDLKKLSEETTLTELVDKVLISSGLKEELENEETLEADIRLENLEEFKSITRSFEEREGVVSLGEFLLEVSLVSDVADYRNETNRVNLMTVHSVKGLEFDYVFIVGLEEGIFPHINSIMDNMEVEEERRLFYVALTRARKKVYLINARMRMLYGKDQVNQPSRFISEIDEKYIDKDEKTSDTKREKEVITNYLKDEEVDYKVDDYLYHDVFGTGKVLEVSDSLITIAFKHPYGIKKLIKNHKSLKKVE